MDQYQSSGQPTININFRIVGIVVALLLSAIALYNSSTTVHSGEGGVLFKRFGGGVDTTRTYGEGFHILAPWNTMIKYKVRQQQVLEKMSVLSSNGLEIDVEVSTMYEPSYKDLPLLHQQKGEDYLNQIVIPSIRSAARSVVGRYTPEQIYSTKRDVIQGEIFLEIEKELVQEFVVVKKVLVRDIALPTKIKDAIEKKLQQEQESLEYEFKLTRAKKEAERQAIDAEGKANANRILNASLSGNILKEKGIQATLELAKSPNAKVIVVGGTDGLPIILGDN